MRRIVDWLLGWAGSVLGPRPSYTDEEYRQGWLAWQASQDEYDRQLP